MKRWIYIALICLFSAIFLFSGFMLIRYQINSNTAQKTYTSLAQIVEQDRQQTTSPPPADPQTTEAEKPILSDYARIYEMNPDLVGWITIDDTKINYPVMQSPDRPNYYLNHNFEKNSSGHGCIYVKEDCDVVTPSDNVVIYGHRMNDGSMFAALHGYKQESFWQAHPTIQFDTLTEHHTYEIVSVFLISAGQDSDFQFHQFVNAENEADFDRFMEQCRSHQLYDTGITAHYGDKLITLSTCEYSNYNGRLVVVARRIADIP